MKGNRRASVQMRSTDMRQEQKRGNLVNVFQVSFTNSMSNPFRMHRWKVLV